MRFFYALTFLFLFAQCSPLKQYPKSSYAWASPEIEYFKALNKKDAPENALLFLGSSAHVLPQQVPHPENVFPNGLHVLNIFLWTWARDLL